MDPAEGLSAAGALRTGSGDSARSADRHQLPAYEPPTSLQQPTSLRFVKYCARDRAHHVAPRGAYGRKHCVIYDPARLHQGGEQPRPLRPTAAPRLGGQPGTEEATAQKENWWRARKICFTGALQAGRGQAGQLPQSWELSEQLWGRTFWGVVRRKGAQSGEIITNCIQVILRVIIAPCN
jgi:hypothetical protein